MDKFIAFFFFFSFLGGANAQQVKMSGVASDFARKQVVVFREADPFSSVREVLAIGDIDDQGKFSVSLEIEETQKILISISRLEGVLYVEPKHNYDIIFPPKGSTNAKRFDRSEITLDLSNLSEGDLNLLIRKFNSDYIQFINNHYYDFVSEEFRGADVYRSSLGEKRYKSDIYKLPESQDSMGVVTSFPKIAQQFITSMEERYKIYFDNLYFRNYVRYSLAEIKLLAGLERKRFYREYIENKPILYQNPTFIKTFQLFYKDAFGQENNAKIDSLSKIINAHQSAEGLSSYFSKDSIFLDSNIRALAMLYNLKGAYYEKRFSKDAVLKTLKSVENSNFTSIQKQIARNTIHQLTRYNKGSKVEEFTIADAREERWKLSENMGIPMYLYFFASWNTTSMKELQLLEKLNSNYKKDVKIFAVCMDDDYSAFLKYSKENRSQQSLLLYGTGDPLITEKLNVRAIPSAVFIDGEGKLLSSYTRTPSEGIEEDFKRLKAQNSKPQSGQKTWRDK